MGIFGNVWENIPPIVICLLLGNDLALLTKVLTFRVLNIC